MATRSVPPRLMLPRALLTLAPLALAACRESPRAEPAPPPAPQSPPAHAASYDVPVVSARVPDAARADTGVAAALGELGLVGTGIGSDGSRCAGLGIATMDTVQGVGQRPFRSGSGLPCALVRVPPTTVHGPLAAPGVRAVLEQNVSALVACHEQHLAPNPQVRGAVGFALTVRASGEVAAAHATRRDNAPVPVAECMLAAMRGWRFPASAAPRETTVTGTVEVFYPE